MKAGGIAGEAQLRDHHLMVGGHRIFARCSDGGPDRIPVILVHGQGVSSRFLEPSARALARDFPVHVPDQPGFGKSEGPARALDVDGLGDFLAAYMGANGIGRAALIGTSFGCQVTVACALRHPDRVARLVLQGPAAAPQDRGALRLIRLWRENGKQEPGDLSLLASEYRRADFRRVFSTFNYYRRYPLEDRLPGVAMPTLVVRGERDRLVPQGWAERVAELLPRARLVVVPGAAHTISRFWPQELADAVRPFLLDG